MKLVDSDKIKIIGATRVRNESLIIKDTLDHLAQFCHEVIVYDDCSTDNTVEICQNHKIVASIIRGTNWDPDRERAEYENRQALFLAARSRSDDNDWFVYIDADERIEFGWGKLQDPSINWVRMKLFDFYITELDKDKDWTHRRFVGPEYREIKIAFRMGACKGYSNPDQRECTVVGRGINEGLVRHYGKAISIRQWEDTCEYYSKHFPRYAEKWEQRKGKAIHTHSDFGRNLVDWELMKLLNFKNAVKLH